MLYFLLLYNNIINIIYSIYNNKRKKAFSKPLTTNYIYNDNLQ